MQIKLNYILLIAFSRNKHVVRIHRNDKLDTVSVPVCQNHNAI